MDELYRSIGIMMHSAQAIERNLSIIIYIDEILSVFKNNEEVPKEIYSYNHERADELFEWMSGATMGEIINRARKTPSMNRQLVSSLERVLNYRNYVAHRLFKEKAFLAGGKTTQIELNSLKKRAEEELKFSNKLNDALLEIIGRLRKEYERIA